MDGGRLVRRHAVRAGLRDRGRDAIAAVDLRAVHEIVLRGHAVPVRIDRAAAVLARADRGEMRIAGRADVDVLEPLARARARAVFVLRPQLRLCRRLRLALIQKRADELLQQAHEPRDDRGDRTVGAFGVPNKPPTGFAPLPLPCASRRMPTTGARPRRAVAARKNPPAVPTEPSSPPNGVSSAERSKPVPSPGHCVCIIGVRDLLKEWSPPITHGTRGG